MPVGGKAIVLGGGTFFHVRPHLALAAPAFGTTADQIGAMLRQKGWEDTTVVKTRMAGGDASLVTNNDVAKLLNLILQDRNVKVLVMNVALCDFEGSIANENGLTLSGKDQPRLKTSEGGQVMQLVPADKLLGRIRKERKDIFLVGFKTTAGASYEEQYRAGLELLKKSSCNLVFANDVQTRQQMIITPEQAIYGESMHRYEALELLAQMTTERANLTFTRSTVVEGKAVPWSATEVPASLRKVVDHLIKRGAYKPFLGSTVGHFAVKVAEGRFLTSIRKSNFNKLDETGLVLVESMGNDRVIAHGARPSVGGQSQRLIFGDHPDTDCIVHAHVPLRDEAGVIPIVPQRPYECGSHECGKNTSEGLHDFGGGLKAVMLDQHGPNVVFNRNMDPDRVIEFIERNWDLTRSTDGVLTAP